MYEEFARSEAFFGREAMQKLYNSKVALFGVGGVGGWCAEALARSGVGEVDLFDGDAVSLSNINRQAVALHSTVGRRKTNVMAERMRDINPDISVREFDIFVDESNIDGIEFSRYDIVLDAIDTVTSKVLIIERACAARVPVISCMGAGNKLDGSAFQVAAIEKTRECPLAKIMRRELRLAGVTGVKAVYSEDKPTAPNRDGEINHRENLRGKRVRRLR